MTDLNSTDQLTYLVLLTGALALVLLIAAIWFAALWRIRVVRSSEIFYQCYQAVAMILHETDLWDEDAGQKLLDMLVAGAEGGAVPHSDLLPFNVKKLPSLKVA